MTTATPCKLRIAYPVQGKAVLECSAAAQRHFVAFGYGPLGVTIEKAHLTKTGETGERNAQVLSSPHGTYGLWTVHCVGNEAGEYTLRVVPSQGEEVSVTFQIEYFAGTPAQQGAVPDLLSDTITITSPTSLSPGTICPDFPVSGTDTDDSVTITVSVPGAANVSITSSTPLNVGQIDGELWYAEMHGATPGTVTISASSTGGGTANSPNVVISSCTP